MGDQLLLDHKGLATLDTEIVRLRFAMFLQVLVQVGSGVVDGSTNLTLIFVSNVGMGEGEVSLHF